METLETTADGRRRLTLHVDDQPANPRTEFDHLEHVATISYRRYIDVDKDNGPHGHALSHYLGRYDTGHAVRLFTRYLAQAGCPFYDHRPTEGPRSIWYLMPADLWEVGDPQEYLKAQATEYQAWAEGDVYGYIIEQRNDWSRTRADGTQETCEGWETIDSCWGFYGYDYAVEAAREAWQHATSVH